MCEEAWPLAEILAPEALPDMPGKSQVPQESPTPKTKLYDDACVKEETQVQSERLTILGFFFPDVASGGRVECTDCQHDSVNTEVYAFLNHTDLVCSIYPSSLAGGGYSDSLRSVNSKVCSPVWPAVSPCPSSKGP